MDLPSVIFALGVAAAAAFDVASRRIPNGLSVALLGLGLAVRFLGGGFDALGWGAAGAAVGLAIFFVPFTLRWLGGGDVKLMAAVGAWLGPAAVAWASLYGVALGGLLSLAVLAAGGRGLRRDVATNLQVAALAGALPRIDPRPARHKVPLAVALGAAALLIFFYGAPHA